MDILHKDGSTLCVEAKFTSMRDSNGQPLGLLAILSKAKELWMPTAGWIPNQRVGIGGGTEWERQHF